MQAINKIILGTVQFGLNYGVNNTTGKLGQNEVDQLLVFAHNSGITCLDTAEAYGNAHDVIGRFHENHPKHLFDIITKLPHGVNEPLKHKIQNYLSQLKVEKLAGILFHSYETYEQHKAELPLLISFKNEGIVDNIGVSIYTNEQMSDVLTDEAVDIIQLPFNMFDNLNKRGELLKEAKDKGKIVHTRSAFLQGLFFLAKDQENRIFKSLLPELKYIWKLSADNKISLQNMALNYCLQQQHIDNVLIGVDNMQQLKQNLTYANNNLSAGILSEINKIDIQNLALLNPSLWNQQ